jgi:catechol 2,3-dioxygenase-like lactoylglutathione lyase family enzyme
VIDLDHVALATRDVADALDALVGELGGLVIFGGNNVGFRAVQVRLGDRADEGLNVELLEPWEVDAHDFLARFVDRHGDGPHHLTFKVDDLERVLAEVDAFGLRPTGVDLSSPNWKEAFLHPKDANGTVVQLAEAHGMPSREEMLKEVRSSGPAGHPRWWPDPPPRVDRSPRLRRVVMRTPALLDATDLFTGVLGGRRVGAGEGWTELAWPGGGRVAFEHRPGTDPGVDRVEVEVSGPGLLGERLVAGTRFVVNGRG